ncbi:hypothetical protein M422DRAFT_265699 [Sphaerobolus stellatus SS14]|uniref:Uncharacterized protein n=1 Tax=Sphaerobolus stellatus (strain SS14) TaxID=990650 RepID=A0A0C9UTG4_SPHS4|nr:hypothetical protein M422DRAFT_265699 [Sphaerobolus stellatus SS14]
MSTATCAPPQNHVSIAHSLSQRGGGKLAEALLSMQASRQPRESTDSAQLGRCPEAKESHNCIPEPPVVGGCQTGRAEPSHRRRRVSPSNTIAGFTSTGEARGSAHKIIVLEGIHDSRVDHRVERCKAMRTTGMEGCTNAAAVVARAYSHSDRQMRQCSMVAFAVKGSEEVEADVQTTGRHINELLDRLAPYATPPKSINTHMHPMLIVNEFYITSLTKTGALLLWILRCSPAVPSVSHQQELCCSIVGIGIRPSALLNKLVPSYKGTSLDGKFIRYYASKSSAEAN